jgi:V8-like Glu-specific endopeptidase
VLTAAHCISSLQRKRAPFRILVMPGRSDRTTMPYGSIESRRFWVPRGFIEGPDRGAWDWGVIELPALRQYPALHAGAPAARCRAVPPGRAGTGHRGRKLRIHKQSELVARVAKQWPQPAILPANGRLPPPRLRAWRDAGPWEDGR